MPPVLKSTESHLKIVVYFSTEIWCTFKIIYTNSCTDCKMCRTACRMDAINDQQELFWKKNFLAHVSGVENA